MSRRPVAPLLATLVALLLPSPGCVERLIYDRICGDGRRSDGEVCLGEGARSSLSVLSLAPLSLRTGDFNGDGHVDLIVLGTDPAGLVAATLFLGDGRGGFAAPLDPGATGCSAHPVPGSIDGDAFGDLLVDDCAPTVSIFRGTATGRFEPAITVLTGVSTHSSGLLDIDGDGNREVVVLGSNDVEGLTLSVAVRNAGGGFEPPILSELSGNEVAAAGGFSIFDFDGDPSPDALLVAGGQPDALWIASGQPGLRFGVPFSVTPPGLVVAWATPRDLDGDGRVEVLAASYDSEALDVLDVRDGGLVQRVRTEVPGLQPGPAAIDDLDSDGVLDVLLAEPGTANLQAWLGREDGRFTGPIHIELDAPVDQMALADLDEDGTLDIIAGSFEAATIRVLLSDP